MLLATHILKNTFPIASSYNIDDSCYSISYLACDEGDNNVSSIQ